MPASRESSVGPIARRGLQPRVHRPYNADDLNFGKRTGIRIDHDGGSDEIQPFDQLLHRLDAQPRPQVPIWKNRRKSTKRAATPILEDADGAQSMELADTPDAYFKTTGQPIAPNSISRVGSSSRPVARVSDVDFDAVPSPRPSSLSQSRRSSRPAGRSDLSKSYLADDDRQYEVPVRSPTQSRSVLKSHVSVTSVGLHADESSRRRSTHSTRSHRDSGADSPEVGRRTAFSVSRLSNRSSYAPQYDQYDDDSDNEPLADPVPGEVYEAEYEPEPMPRAATPGRPSTSFSQLDQTDDDEGEKEDEVAPAPRFSAREKGKGRASDVPPAMDEEDVRLTNGRFDESMLDDVPDVDPFDGANGVEGESQGEEEEPQKPISDGKRRKKRKSDEARVDDELAAEDDAEADSRPKKSKKTKTPKPKADKPKSQAKRVRATKPLSSNSQKENLQKEIRLPVHSEPTPDPDEQPGLRRGKRVRYAPLEWWRLERVEYGAQRESQGGQVAEIKAIVRIPQEEPQPLGAKRKKGKRAASMRPRPRSKSQSKAVDEEQELEDLAEDFNPEEGWDDKTEPYGVVKDWDTGDEVERRIAFTAKMVQPRASENATFLYQKIFGDGEFIAAGELILPVGGEKPSKNSKDNTYIFYVIEGAVQIKVHRTSLILCSGGTVIVPRGNMYYIQNIANRDSKLFFTQARKMPTSTTDGPPASPRKSRTDSAGPTDRPRRRSSTSAVPS
ncbi:hypothetical protein PUNSTDRAFT_135711 [Punctularia strigosozonata HHB-11173 SS5]|uniref:uncharacterized protein n=1 Tax=Punctularia strigosozonata (strain HHB-11173) TaxID=741275 RepID=UPI0004418541|nr:uncharacterized protein PUNSTDRAFT_135711 [Punctularia strigosozonata HHB-11173 SS5]EIN07013.1 hypothetical protein PUNSTDRAFT_135711 [Punctularia strigosozonata HHB-11173 SS5]